MRGRVIQGYFPSGQMRPLPAPRGAVQRVAAGTRPGAGPPPPAFARAAAGPLQPSGGRPGDFAIDPVQVGLSRAGGAKLPPAVMAKMEAALGADFSAVRIHVGPQAARIGAIAFTTGNDIYFAPGKYQPESVQGQQLLGHELAHVIQQRQGRVRTPGSGVTVVNDHALEAEADRLGIKAAAYVTPVQAKRESRPTLRASLQRQSIQRAAAGPYDKVFVNRPTIAEYPDGMLAAVANRQKVTPQQWAQVRPENYIVCPSCKEMVPVATAHVDHYPVAWESLLSMNHGQVPGRVAFDQGNLQFMCGRCNSSNRHNADLGGRTTRGRLADAIADSEGKKYDALGMNKH